MADSERRINVEFRLRAVVSNYGGERIVADNPAIERMIRQLADEAEALARDGLLLGDDSGHIIEFRPDGWTIQHPLACRPNLFACPVNRAAEHDLAGGEVPPGRYECEVNDIGDRFLIGDRLPEVTDG